MILYHTMLYDVMSYYIILGYAMLCYIIVLCHILHYSIISYYIILNYIISRRGRSRAWRRWSTAWRPSPGTLAGLALGVRPCENMVGVNMVLAEFAEFKHGLYKSCRGPPVGRARVVVVSGHVKTWLE